MLFVSILNFHSRCTDRIAFRYRAHNSRKGGVSYTRGVNMWTDLTQEEWESTHLGYTRIAMVNTSRGGQDSSRYRRSGSLPTWAIPA